MKKNVFPTTMESLDRAMNGSLEDLIIHGKNESYLIRQHNPTWYSTIALSSGEAICDGISLEQMIMFVLGQISDMPGFTEPL